MFSKLAEKKIHFGGSFKLKEEKKFKNLSDTFSNKLWNPKTLCTLGISGKITTAAHDPIQNLIAVATESGNIHIFGTPGVSSQPGKLKIAQDVPIIYLKFHSGYPIIIAVDTLNTITIFDTYKQRFCGSYTAPDIITCVEIIDGTPWLLVGQDSGRIYILNIEKCIKSDFSISFLGKGYKQPIASIKTFPESQTQFVIAYLDGQLVEYNLAEKIVVGTYLPTPNMKLKDNSENLDSCKLTNITFNHDGKRLAVCFENGLIESYSVEKNKIHKKETIISVEKQTDSSIDNNGSEPQDNLFYSDLTWCEFKMKTGSYIVASVGASQWERNKIIFIEADGNEHRIFDLGMPILYMSLLQPHEIGKNSDECYLNVVMDDGSLNLYEFSELGIFDIEYQMKQIYLPNSLEWSKTSPLVLDIFPFSETSTVISRMKSYVDENGFSSILNGGLLLTNNNRNSTENQPFPMDDIFDIHRLDRKDPETQTEIAITYGENGCIDIWNVGKSTPALISKSEINFKELSEYYNLELVPCKFSFNENSNFLAIGTKSGAVLVYYIGENPPEWIIKNYKEQSPLNRSTNGSLYKGERSASSGYSYGSQVSRETSGGSHSSNYSQKNKDLHPGSLLERNGARNSVHSNVGLSPGNTPKADDANPINPFMLKMNHETPENSNSTNTEHEILPKKVKKNSFSSGFSKILRISEGEHSKNAENSYKTKIESMPLNDLATNEKEAQIVYPISIITHHKYPISSLITTSSELVYVADSHGLISKIDIKNGSGRTWTLNESPDSIQPATFLKQTNIKIHKESDLKPVLIAGTSKSHIKIFRDYEGGTHQPISLDVPDIGKIIYIDSILAQKAESLDDGKTSKEQKNYFLLVCGEMGIVIYFNLTNKVYAHISMADYEYSRIVASKIYSDSVDQLMFLEILDDCGKAYAFSIPKLELLLKSEIDSSILSEFSEYYFSSDGGVFALSIDKKLIHYKLFESSKQKTDTKKAIVFNQHIFSGRKKEEKEHEKGWLWRISSSDSNDLSFLEKNCRNILAKYCTLPSFVDSSKSIHGINNSSSPEQRDSREPDDNQKSTDGNHHMLSETTNKLIERGERLEQVNESTSRMANAASDFLNDIRSHNAKQASKKCPMECLARERANPSFDVEDMENLIDGGKQVTEVKKQMFMEMERDQNWVIEDYPNLTMEETRERAMKKVKNLADKLMSEPKSKFTLRMSLISVVDPGFWTRFGVHMGLFLGAVQGQATPSQLNYWAQKGAFSLKGMYGCFGMTELGHGSNVAGLETTATFDKERDQFVIHTPTLTATKWWIGGAAHSATHCSVFARLIIDNKDYGVKTFIVPLRNPETWELLAGISIGDIGKKMGRDQIDNGWIQFTNVRIPRSYMLMKHTKVSASGKVSEPPMAQLAYGALIMGRVSMVEDSANVAKRALTIAIRYAAVRHQFSNGPPGSPETKLLDYVTHQHRLLPLLAQTFAIGFAAKKLTAQFDSLMKNLQSARPGSDVKMLLQDLKETHSTSAGLKAFCTWTTLNIIDQCRQSLGGHGYSAYVGLSGSYQDFAVHCTWEGDNTILMLQCGRFLVSSADKYKKGLAVPENLRYLEKAGTSEKWSKCETHDPELVCSIESLKEGWACVSAYAILRAHKLYKKHVDSGLTQDQAYEASSAARLHATRMHITAYLFHCLADAVNLPECKPGLKGPITQLALLYGVSTAIHNSGEFLMCQYFDSKQVNVLKGKLDDLCQSVRKIAVLLVDSFGYTDYVVNSPLGRYDGNVYESYFGTVKKLNPVKKVPYFETIIKPLMTRSLEAEEGHELEIDLE
ncbi:hypothetical protein BB558_004798 [Smittium angustum]|uniref:acyl-CoA oxidase n=1 Tax=Smittium angustum TaxID=133377 RepID=A0A2U1J2C7_SMIAN|nr:hypothetical protein BB558_004798 [Smittium angustum]